MQWLQQPPPPTDRPDEEATPLIAPELGGIVKVGPWSQPGQNREKEAAARNVFRVNGGNVNI